MKRASRFLVSAAIVMSAVGLSVTPVTAYSAHVWSNSDAFTKTCIGVSDTYPASMYSLNVGQFTKLGFSPVSGALGPNFTRSNFLSAVVNDYAVYVHSHGDNYRAASGSGIDSAFLQDPGSGDCNDSNDKVRASAIKAATAGTPYNIVIMSTCYLGSSKSTMPAAFQIEKVKNATQFEFFLGYQVETWDSDQLRFEKAFWSYMNGGAAHTRWLSEAFTYASGIGGYGSVSGVAFKANWWGNPQYDGTPLKPTTGCPTCNI